MYGQYIDGIVCHKCNLPMPILYDNSGWEISTCPGCNNWYNTDGAVALGKGTKRNWDGSPYTNNVMETYVRPPMFWDGKRPKLELTRISGEGVFHG